VEGPREVIKDTLVITKTESAYAHAQHLSGSHFMIACFFVFYPILMTIVRNELETSYMSPVKCLLRKPCSLQVEWTVPEHGPNLGKETWEGT
jgi:hypothetical protein